MSNISGQLIKNSYDYVLQSDLITGVVYRIGGSVPLNPKFTSGLTVNASFTYADGSEFPGYVLTCDALGNATWAPSSATTSGIFVTGGTFNYTTGTLQLVNSNGSQVTISGLTDTYVTGGTVSGTSIVFSYNNTNTFQVTGITPYNLFSSYTATTQSLILNSVTGGTYSNGTLNLINNSGGTVQITGFTTGTTDSYVTGFSLNNDTIILSQNRLDQYSSFTISLSGYVSNNTFSSYTASTQPLILNAVTGGTYSGGTLFLITNSGNTVQITGFSTSISGNYLPLSGGTVTGNTIFTSGLTATTISATTYQNLPISGLTAGQNISISGLNGNFIISYTGSTGSSSNLQYFVTGSTPSGVTLNSGDRWFDTTTGDELVWIDDGNSSQWLQICCGSGGSNLQYFISASTPTGTINSGDRWFNTTTGIELVWINDGDSSQWVQPFSVPGPAGQDLGVYSTTGITSSQTITWDKTYWGISGSTNVDLSLPTTVGKDGYYLIIKDESGICGNYRIRLTPSIGLIDGNNYVDMNINYMSLTCMSRGGNWYLI